jgi:hypothetical protein
MSESGQRSPGPATAAQKLGQRVPVVKSPGPKPQDSKPEVGGPSRPAAVPVATMYGTKGSCCRACKGAAPSDSEKSSVEICHADSDGDEETRSGSNENVAEPAKLARTTASAESVEAVSNEPSTSAMEKDSMSDVEPSSDSEIDIAKPWLSTSRWPLK